MFEEKSLLIGNETVQKYMDIDGAIDIIAKTWEWFGDDKIIMPSKITTDMSSAGVAGWFNSMPCYISPLDIAGIKIVGGYDGNKKNNLPYIKANVVLRSSYWSFKSSSIGRLDFRLQNRCAACYYD